MHRNRPKAILEQVSNYNDVADKLNAIFEQDFQPTTKHPFVSDKLMKSFASLLKELGKSRVWRMRSPLPNRKSISS